jgi:RNA polymerase sigma-70 factor (ECF subfamily)
MAARRLRDREDIMDVVQETLARTLVALRAGRIPDGVSVGAYAHGVALHVIADVHRERNRTVPTSLEVEPPDPGACPLTHLVREEDCAAVREALVRLDRKERDLLVACFVRGERIAAIATRTGEPAERLRKRKSRAIARLREILGVSS